MLNNTVITAPTRERIAATLMITNMIASENAGAVIPPSMPEHPYYNDGAGLTESQEAQGLIQGSSSLPSRAHMHAPTPSAGIAGLNVLMSVIEGMSTLAPDSGVDARVLTTKRTRELEREEREK